MQSWLHTGIIILGMLWSGTSIGQDVRAVPLSQYELLQSFELEYLAPVEVEGRSIAEGSILGYRYQFGVELVGVESVVLVALQPDYTNIVPHVTAVTKVSSLATNEQDAVIAVKSPSSSYVQELNADWCAHATFLAKDNRYGYQYGSLQSMYREGIGLVHMLQLSAELTDTRGVLRFMDLD